MEPSSRPPLLKSTFDPCTLCIHQQQVKKQNPILSRHPSQSIYSQTAVTINLVFLLSLMLSICLATNYRIRPYLFLCQTPRVPYPSAEEKNHRKSSKTKSRGNVAAAAGTRFDERRVFVERRWYDFVICMRLIVKYLFFVTLADVIMKHLSSFLNLFSKSTFLFSCLMGWPPIFLFRSVATKKLSTKILFPVYSLT